MMLFTFLKSYQRNVFTNNNHQCPVELHQIEAYVIILLPLHMFTKEMQSFTANISQVLPAIITILYENLDRMILNDSLQDSFRNALIHFLKVKFDYELNSKVYAVAAILNVENFDHWKERGYGKKYFIKGIESLEEILLKYSSKDEEKSKRNKDPNNNPYTNQVVVNSQVINFEGYSNLSSICRPRIRSEAEEPDENLLKIKKEVSEYVSIITETKITVSTKKFWLDNKKKFPNLFKLTLRLLSIPATSAHIERFFSVAGIINSKHSTNISDDLLIERSLLKANIKLLENFNK